jgi:hypothetical protein
MSSMPTSVPELSGTSANWGARPSSADCVVVAIVRTLRGCRRERAVMLFHEAQLGCSDSPAGRDNVVNNRGLVPNVDRYTA